MKAIAKLLIIFVLLFAATYSCDVIDDPYEHIQGVDTGIVGTDADWVVTYADSVFEGRRIVVEDYTGIACGNCPQAGRKLIEYIATQGDTFIPIAVQAGGDLLAVPDAKHPIDLRTDASYDYYSAITLKTGIPFLLVNFKSDHGFAQEGNFAAKCDSLINSSQFHTDNKIKLNVTCSLDLESGYLEVLSDCEFLQDGSGQIDILVYLLESNIKAPQTDYKDPDLLSDPDFPTNKNFIHDHVLRNSLPSAWGEILVNGSYTTGQIINSSIETQVPLDDFDATKCDVVVMAMDASTKEIIQANIVYHIGEK